MNPDAANKFTYYNLEIFDMLTESYQFPSEWEVSKTIKVVEEGKRNFRIQSTLRSFSGGKWSKQSTIPSDAIRECIR